MPHVVMQLGTVLPTASQNGDLSGYITFVLWASVFKHSYILYPVVLELTQPILLVHVREQRDNNDIAAQNSRGAKQPLCGLYNIINIIIASLV